MTQDILSNITKGDFLSGGPAAVEVDRVAQWVVVQLARPNNSAHKAQQLSDALHTLLPHWSETDKSRMLRNACDMGDVAVVALLVPHSNAKAFNSAALQWALEQGHRACAKLVLPHSDPENIRSFICGTSSESMMNELLAEIAAETQRIVLENAIAHSASSSPKHMHKI